MIKLVDLGICGYKEVWDYQKDLLTEMVEAKKRGEQPSRESLILVEHPDVITLGRHAKHSNLLFPADYYKRQGVDVYEIERGGDVTFHGPGQLVVYPIIDLEQHRLGVKKYVDLLEEAVIGTIRHWDITGERVEGATGVWIGKGTSEERKICAIGVKCSRFVTMHGLGLNVNTDLERFNLINPCGFTDKGVTSISKEIGVEADMGEVKKILVHNLLELL